MADARKSQQFPVFRNLRRVARIRAAIQSASRASAHCVGKIRARSKAIHSYMDRLRSDQGRRTYRAHGARTCADGSLCGKRVRPTKENHHEKDGGRKEEGLGGPKMVGRERILCGLAEIHDQS